MRLPQGWPLVGVASAALVALHLVWFAWAGTDEAGLRMVVRASARVSFAIFLLAYLARPARQLWPTPATRWLQRNRRHLGVSFAVAHGLHGLDILLLARQLGAAFELNLVTLVGGGLAYVLLAAMTLTSFDRSARWLGPRRWKLLHRVGIHYLWFIFAQNWTGAALQSPFYLPFALASWGALGIRIAAWRAATAEQRSPGAEAIR
jgi:DMSO/TMAO reductase YedYZ heme-binding membrane subunit